MAVEGNQAVHGGSELRLAKHGDRTSVEHSAVSTHGVSFGGRDNRAVAVGFADTVIIAVDAHHLGYRVAVPEAEIMADLMTEMMFATPGLPMPPLPA